MNLGTICARAGSKGVPGKNFKLLLGKPLIQYTIDEAKDCELLDDIIISTDSVEIAEIGRKSGIKVPFVRPPDLASDTAGKWEVFRHALNEYENIFGKKVEYLVDLDVTAPLKTSADISNAITFAKENPDADLIVCGYDPDRNPYFTMVEINSNGFAELSKNMDPPIVRRQDAPTVYSLSAAVYVVSRNALLKYKHWTQSKCKVFLLSRERAMDIDSELDFSIIECLLQKKLTSSN
ncbi:acylneuraminate cytidylyltransferase family protein [soil metagenome]